jgi:hypothetical protein
MYTVLALGSCSAFCEWAYALFLLLSSVSHGLNRAPHVRHANQHRALPPHSGRRSSHLLRPLPVFIHGLDAIMTAAAGNTMYRSVFKLSYMVTTRGALKEKMLTTLDGA